MHHCQTNNEPLADTIPTPLFPSKCYIAIISPIYRLIYNAFESLFIFFMLLAVISVVNY